MAGGGGYFSIAGVNKLLLEPLFNDPQFRHTNFVLLHGGWPYIRKIGSLLQKPNVFLDVSQESLLFPPRTLAGFLREWLETYPDKVLFGTDGYPFTDSLGWEESTWIASNNARQAIALVFCGMLADNELDRARAHALAEAVLNGTARKLYGQ
jgi:predicted TIM-barrel fold metal-dependent hydrolase